MINRLAGKKAMRYLTSGIRKIIPGFPLWTDQIPVPPSLSVLKREYFGQHFPANNTVVYFPGCISRLLGSSPTGGRNIMEAFLSVSSKAGFRVIVSKDIKGACCGQIFSSKGFYDAYQFAANKIAEQLWEATVAGKYPVIMDISSCAITLQNIRPVLSTGNQQRFDKLKIMDSIDYLHDKILPLIPPARKKKDIVLHPVCSLQKMGIEDKFIRIAKFFSDKVTIPKNAGCCGMAGDRGFLFPELTASATHAEAQEVKASDYEGYYSSTRTCEMAMSEAVGKNYESILFLADESMIGVK
jgi:D-lactate dehydrogenase